MCCILWQGVIRKPLLRKLLHPSYCHQGSQGSPAMQPALLAICSSSLEAHDSASHFATLQTTLCCWDMSADGNKIGTLLYMCCHLKIFGWAPNNPKRQDINPFQMNDITTEMSVLCGLQGVPLILLLPSLPPKQCQQWAALKCHLPCGILITQKPFR